MADLRIYQPPLGVVSPISCSKVSKDAIAAPAPELRVQAGERSVAVTYSPQPVCHDRVAHKHKDGRW